MSSISLGFLTLTIIIAPKFHLDKEKNGSYDLNFWDWEKDRKKFDYREFLNKSTHS